MDPNMAETQSPQQQQPHYQNQYQHHSPHNAQHSNDHIPMNNNQSGQQQTQQPQQANQPPYSIPGILHYLQYEWHRFEVQRSEWEVEKAELSARVALLQGEKRAHENLKHDLIRRIKMLEQCLRMERAKYHKLKHGVDPPIEEITNQASSQQSQTQNRRTNEDDASARAQNDDDANFNTNTNNNSSTVAYGRELLKHYLQEIGYTDTIIDLRSNRVRSLLGLVDSQYHNPITNNINSNDNNDIRHKQDKQAPTQSHPPPGNQSVGDLTGRRNVGLGSSGGSISSSSGAKTIDSNQDITMLSMNKDNKSNLIKSSMLTNNTGTMKPSGEGLGAVESSVLATFGFLYDEESMKNTSRHLDDDDDDNETEAITEDMVDAADRAASIATSEYSYFEKERGESTAIMKQKIDSLNNRNDMDDHGKDYNRRKNSNDISANTGLSKATDIQQQRQTIWTQNREQCDAFDLGELASLTTTIDSNVVNDQQRKQWTAKFRLQSHFDCVRALKFVVKEPLLVTASEDETIKLWHLARPAQSSGKSKQNANLPPTLNAITNSLEGNTIIDLDPIHTYRGHKSRILCLTIYKEHIYTGAQNGELFMWKLIHNIANVDQYDEYDKSLLVCKYEGHDDAIWAVDFINPRNAGALLCSASSDLTIKLWNGNGEVKEPIRVIKLDNCSPTSIASIPLNISHQIDVDVAIGFDDGIIRLYNIDKFLESTAPTAETSSTNQTDLGPNSNNTHQQLEPIGKLIIEDTVNSTEDSSTTTNRKTRINSIVMHPTLSYLASADSNHDVKFWNLQTSQCLSTMVAHLDEVTSIAFEPSGKYLISGSHDCSIRIWLINEDENKPLSSTLSCVQDIASHRRKFDEGILALAFHPKLPHFASAGADGLIKVFM